MSCGWLGKVERVVTKRPHQSLRDSFSKGEATLVPSPLERGDREAVGQVPLQKAQVLDATP
jgi:hypothetical protein